MEEMEDAIRHKEGVEEEIDEGIIVWRRAYCMTKTMRIMMNF